MTSYLDYMDAARALSRAALSVVGHGVAEERSLCGTGARMRSVAPEHAARLAGELRGYATRYYPDVREFVCFAGNDPDSRAGRAALKARDVSAVLDGVGK